MEGDVLLKVEGRTDQTVKVGTFVRDSAECVPRLQGALYLSNGKNGKPLASDAVALLRGIVGEFAVGRDFCNGSK